MLWTEPLGQAALAREDGEKCCTKIRRFVVSEQLQGHVGSYGTRNVVGISNSAPRTKGR